MGRYILRRLLQMIPVIIGTTFIIFMMVYALPGDPFATACGERACSPQYIAARSAELGLDQPILVQYWNYLTGLLQGDFGETVSGVQVIDRIGEVYPNTVKLAVVAILVEIFVGVTAGIVAGLRRGGFIDSLVLVTTTFLVSIPVFVIAFSAQYVVGVRLGWAPPTVSGDSPICHYILPGIVLASLSTAYVARLMRTNLAENLRSDYVRTAKAKGLPRRRVVGIHTLRNSLIPVVTFLGAEFGTLIGGAIVTEGIFNINGVGGLVFRSIRVREGAMVTGVITVLVLVYLFASLLVDLLYAVLDPRIRYE